MRQLALGVKLPDGATYANFVTGRNAELLAALTAGSNHLWLWGAAGCGKTHLLQAACAACEGPAAYLPLGDPMQLPPEALAGFEGAGVVCLDDLGSVAGDIAWERALFALFNACVEQRTRLILAAEAAPRSLPWVLEDWRSRAAACVVYQVRELDEAGRIEALRRRAAQRGLELPADTADYLMKRTARDLRSLLRLLDQLDEASLEAQRRLTVPFIRDALERT
ncbi:MAG: DnaA regulatory inactivator Hda [Gammaproteobacteria bacterium]|nr:DnaA regulatory inactivator Hda [Gammaproteobacteria bacterium]